MDCLIKDSGQTPFFEYIKTQADPSAVAVLLEDSATCVGVLIALTRLTLAHLTGNVLWDAVATISIGLLLGTVAVWLITRNHAIWIGLQSAEDAKTLINFQWPRHLALLNKNVIVRRGRKPQSPRYPHNYLPHKRGTKRHSRSS